MIKSMTGYGNGASECEGKEFTVEIRSVNHRYSDLNVKYPRAYSFAEDAVRKRVGQYVKRGKVDVFITVENTEASLSGVKVDVNLAKSYLSAMRTLGEELNLPLGESLNPLVFLRIPDVFLPDKPEENQEEILAALISALDKALENFDKMRRTEGEKLKEDMSAHLDVIEGLTASIEERAPKIVQEYMQRIRLRMEELLGEVSVDENRLLNEVAVFSDRIDVNEEIVRLKSHISQMREMLCSPEPVGRKLDFLIQEMNREINTTGSKSNDLEIAKLVIEVKAEIEKLREQCQNIE